MRTTADAYQTLRARSVPDGECIVWMGARTPAGYGTLRVDGKVQYVHRLAYAATSGPIPDSMTVDHLCFTRACVKPDHLRLLTLDENRSNQRRKYKTTCVNGHPFTEANTKRTRQGRGRECRECSRIQCRAWYARRGVKL